MIANRRKDFGAPYRARDILYAHSTIRNREIPTAQIHCPHELRATTLPLPAPAQFFADQEFGLLADSLPAQTECSGTSPGSSPVRDWRHLPATNTKSSHTRRHETELGAEATPADDLRIS